MAVFGGALLATTIKPHYSYSTVGQAPGTTIWNRWGGWPILARLFSMIIGCGRSDKPDDPSLYSIDHFSEEIDALLRILKIEKVLLYGHGFGGWFALEYMARHGTEAPVEALILAFASSSARQNMEGKRRLLREMPDNLEQQLIRIERSGLENRRAYAAIVQSFSRAHLFDCVGPPPEIFINSVVHMEWSRSYPIMNGPNEFSITGNLRSWDRETSLKHIKVPTLVLTSEWDEVTMDSQISLHRESNIRNWYLSPRLVI